MTAVRSGCSQRLEIADFALAEHEHAAAAQVGVEARQRQPGFLRVRNGDVAVEPVAAGEQLEIERAGIGQIAQQGGDGDAAAVVAGRGHRSLSLLR